MENGLPNSSEPELSQKWCVQTLFCSVFKPSWEVRYPNTQDGFLCCIRENDAAVSFQMGGIPLVCKWGIVFTWG